MKRYLNKDTGELFTEHDLKVLWDQFGHEMKFDSYDDFTDSLEEVEVPGFTYGIITVDEFKKVVEEFGFEHPVTTAVWNAMDNNPENADEFETIYAMWATGKFA